MDKDLEEVCDEYLLSRHCTLWGEPFEIISKKGRAEAVRWLSAVVRDIDALRSPPSA